MRSKDRHKMITGVQNPTKECRRGNSNTCQSYYSLAVQVHWKVASAIVVKMVLAQSLIFIKIKKKRSNKLKSGNKYLDPKATSRLILIEIQTWINWAIQISLNNFISLVSRRKRKRLRIHRKHLELHSISSRKVTSPASPTMSCPFLIWQWATSRPTKWGLRAPIRHRQPSQKPKLIK